MRLDAGLDTGDLLLREKTPISTGDTAQTLHDRLADRGADPSIKTLQSLRAATLQAQPQDPEQASFAPP